jgi:hypothetical protein
LARQVPPPGFKQGTRGSSLPAITPTVWKAGGTTEVAWSLQANHGGGRVISDCHFVVQLIATALYQVFYHNYSVAFVLKWQSATILSLDGGYQYRLCPKGKNVTEECFQRMPLEPVLRTHDIVYGVISHRR